MTYNIFKVRNKNGNLRLRYSGGVLNEKGSLNGRKLSTLGQSLSFLSLGLVAVWKDRFYFILYDIIEFNGVPWGQLLSFLSLRLVAVWKDRFYFILYDIIEFNGVPWGQLLSFLSLRLVAVWRERPFNLIELK
jgi:hypothetical protein